MKNRDIQKITVITVSYNAVDTIEQTIVSVLNQTYLKIEYIIIDGGSTDGTVDIIKKYADRIAYWVSEPDRGIYDAMNKGIEAATGEWVNFMNSGDSFANDNVLFEVFKIFPDSSIHVIYGKTLTKYKWGTYIVSPPAIHVLEKRMCLCHQSTIIRLSMQKKYKYDLSCKLAADYLFFHKLYLLSPTSFCFFPNVIARYDAIYGVSAVNCAAMHQEASNIAGHKLYITSMKQQILTFLPDALRNRLLRVYMFFNSRFTRVSLR